MKWSSASLAALGLGSTPAFLRRAMAAQSTVGKKVMFIFLRGGIDGVQTIIPYGDEGTPGETHPQRPEQGASKKSSLHSQLLMRRRPAQ